MGGAHAHRVVHEHGGGARALARGDDELLRTGSRGIPRGVEPGDRRAARPVDERWPSTSRSTSSAVEEVERRVPLRADEAAVDVDTGAVDEAHGRDGAAVAFEVVDAPPLDDDPGCRELGLFDRVDDIGAVREDGEVVGPARDQPGARGQVGVSPMSASGRSCSSHASHAAQLKSVMP